MDPLTEIAHITSPEGREFALKLAEAASLVESRVTRDHDFRDISRDLMLEWSRVFTITDEEAHALEELRGAILNDLRHGERPAGRNYAALADLLLDPGRNDELLQELLTEIMSNVP